MRKTVTLILSVGLLWLFAGSSNARADYCSEFHFAAHDIVDNCGCDDDERVSCGWGEDTLLDAKNAEDAATSYRNFHTWLS